MRSWRFALVPTSLLCVACAAADVDPRADQERARALIREATGEREVFDPERPALAQDEIEALLADGLGVDEARRLALLNSRRLQASFAGLGVARADFVQAGLLKNPSLGVAFLLPSGGGQPKITLDFVQSLVDLWELPERQQIAEGALEQRIFELSRLAGELVVDTQDAYFESVAARDLLAGARANAGVAREMLEAVRGRVRGGVATTLDENLAESQALGAELALRRTERESFAARRRLAALLSLDGDRMDVELIDALPEPARGALDREALVARVRSTRLDVRAAEAAVATADRQLALERRRTIPDVEAGVSLERPESGASVDALLGPTAAVELPLFDRNHAQVRRAEFRRDELRLEYEALACEVEQALRVAVDQADAAARAARFVTGELVPQADRSLALARTSYDLGDSTLLTLLESQRASLQARSANIEALLEAARARIDVERAAGASLDVLLGVAHP